MALAQVLNVTEHHVAPADVGSRLLPAIGPRVNYARDEEIFGEGEPADYVYQVVEGVVRTCRFSSDGRRQINDFHLAGEYFGLESGRAHGCSAEAVGNVTVVLLRRSTLTDLANRDLAVAGQLIELTMRALERTQAHVEMLNHKGACERLSAFLMDFADRSHAKAAVELPMSRQEIGDYLGLTIETVSRTFTQLEADRTISLAERRRVLLRDRERLAASF